MASIFSHIAVPVGIALGLGKKRIPRSLMEAGMMCSVWADIDCAGFAFGIPYQSQFGHRGFTHSIVFAIAFAALWAWRQKEFDVSRRAVFIYCFLCGLSHPLIDMLTDGGMGIAIFWPLSTQRFFWPYRLIPVSPIGGSFFSERGLYVFTSELWMIWLPCLVLGGLGFLIRKAWAQRHPAAPA